MYVLLGGISACFLEVSNEICAVFLPPHSRVVHPSARNVLSGICEIDFQGFLSPHNALVLVGISVLAVPLRLTSGAAKESMKVWSLKCIVYNNAYNKTRKLITGSYQFMSSSLFNGVALSTNPLEKFPAFLDTLLVGHFMSMSCLSECQMKTAINNG